MDPADIPALALQLNAKQLRELTGMSEHASEWITKAVGMTVEDFSNEVRSKLQGVAAELVEKLKNDVNELKPMQRVIAMGILMDKLNTQPKAVSQALHIHLKGDIGGALKSILGPAGERISAADRAFCNTGQLIEVTATPSQYTGPTALDATARDVESRAKKQ